jgi:hypothetical protein
MKRMVLGSAARGVLAPPPRGRSRPRTARTTVMLEGTPVTTTLGGMRSRRYLR